MVCCTTLFLWRSSSLKRPLVKISAFRYPRFWLGLCLLALYFGIKESLNLLFGYAGGVLQWSPSEVTQLGLYNIAGLVTFMIISVKLILGKKFPVPMFFILGFGILLWYHLWVYYNLTPDLSYSDLIIPMFLQGAASGLLFVPIMAFALSSLPATTGMTGIVVAAYVRFISLLNVSAGFYNLQLFYSQYFKEGYLRHTSNLDLMFSERLGTYRQLFLSKGIPVDQAEKIAQLNLSRAVAIQAQLMSIRATFLIFSWIIGVVIVLILMILIIVIIKKRLAPPVETA